jgi:hemoglobin-like flavoprotein
LHKFTDFFFLFVPFFCLPHQLLKKIKNIMIPPPNTIATDTNKTCPYFTSAPSSMSPTLDPVRASGSMSPPPTTSPTQTTIQQRLDSQSFLRAPHSPTIATRIYPDENPPTQAQIDIVRYTWERISELRLPGDDPNVSTTHAFGLAFYDALFELDPSLRPLFTNIFKQARALAGMVSYIARAPNITGPRKQQITSPGSSPSLPNTCGLISACPAGSGGAAGIIPQDRALTIREINAMKRKESTATSFSELIASVAAAASERTAVSRQQQEDMEGDTDKLLYKLRELGARHYFYQVQPHQLDLIGPAVLKAIKKRLGKEFLPEVAEAWTRVF